MVPVADFHAVHAVDRYWLVAAALGVGDGPKQFRVPVPAEALASGARTGELVVRLEVSDSLPGGLAIYGSRFGRYPVDPTIIFVLR